MAHVKDTLNDRTSLLFPHGPHEVLCFPSLCKWASRTWKKRYSKKRRRLRQLLIPRQSEEVSSEIQDNPENVLPPLQTEFALTKNSVMAVNQNGSRFLLLKQTLEDQRGEV
jgi:hypothetical protein